MEELLETVFSIVNLPRLYKENHLAVSWECEDIRSHGLDVRYLPASIMSKGGHYWDSLLGNR
jgi:hypothetical protein